MKRILSIFLTAALPIVIQALLSSCSKEGGTAVERNEGDESGYEDSGILRSRVGMTFVCSMPDSSATKVTVEGGGSATSRLSWQKDDEITIRYKGENYRYKAMSSGRTKVSFTPVSEVPGDFIPEDVTFDYENPLYFYYNVVPPATGASSPSASFTISPNQNEGSLDNKMPLTGYLEHPTSAIRNGTVHFRMRPAAQVLQLKIMQASATAGPTGSPLASKLKLTSFAASGFLSGSFSVNPVDGTVTPPPGTAASEQTLTVSFASTRKFTSAKRSDPQDVYIIVGPASIGEMRARLLDAGGNLCFLHSFYLSKTVSLTGRHIYTELPNGISNGPDLFYACERSQTDPYWSLFSSGEKTDDGKPVVYFTADVDAYEASHKELYWDSLRDGGNAMNYATWSTIGSFWTNGGFLVVKGGETVINWPPYLNGSKFYKLSESCIDGKCPIGNYGGICSNVKFYCNRQEFKCGLLADMYNSTARNLSMSGSIDHQCTDARSYAGSLASYALGKCSFIGITNNMTITATCENDNVSGQSYHTVGGIVSAIRDIDHSGSSPDPADAYFENCVNKAPLTAYSKEYSRVGGIAGYSTNAASNCGHVSFKGCTNSAALTSKSARTAALGGMTAQVYQFPVKDSDGMSAVSCTNSGKLVAVSNDGDTGGVLYAGGIVGRFCYGNKFIVKGCRNTGNISLTNNSAYVCAGGLGGNIHPDHLISGDLGYVTLGGTAEADRNENTGTVSGTFTKPEEDDIYIGGIAGRILSSSQIVNCINSGTISSSSTSLSIFQGGIVAEIGAHAGTLPEGEEDDGGEDEESEDPSGVYFTYKFSKCSNSGAITGNGTDSSDRLGGILGAMSTNVRKCDIQNCSNSGKITSKSQKNLALGGIVAQLGASTAGGKFSPEKSGITSCTNTANITSAATIANTFTGGIAGTVRSSFEIVSCKSSNCTIDGGSGNSQNTGGIVGLFDSSYQLKACIADNLSVKGGDYVGGVAGVVENYVSVIDCQTHGGSVTGSGYLVGGIAGGVYMTAGNTGCSILFKHCRLNNGAKVTGGDDYVGGILGGLHSSSHPSCTLKMDNNYLQGTPVLKGKASIGGIIGRINPYCDATAKAEVNLQIYNSVIGSLQMECAEGSTANPTFGGLIGEVQGTDGSSATVRIINNVVWGTTMYHHKSDLTKVYSGGAIGYCRPNDGYSLTVSGFSTTNDYTDLYYGSPGSSTRSYSSTPPSGNPIGSVTGRTQGKNVSASYLYVLTGPYGDMTVTPTNSTKYSSVNDLKTPNVGKMNGFRNAYSGSNPSKSALMTWKAFSDTDLKAYISY